MMFIRSRMLPSGHLSTMVFSFFGYIALVFGSQADDPATVSGKPPLESTAKVSSVHPRIWLTPDLVAKLKVRARNNDPRWLKLKASADSFLANPPAPDKFGGAIQPAANAALAYQVTGNPKYARTAVEVTVKSLPVIFASRDNYHDVRSWGPKIAAIFDWCYDQLSSSQKNQIAKWLMDQADAVWPETSGGKRLWGGMDPANNYFWGSLESWVFALAVYGDEPRAPRHLRLALQHFEEIAKPFLNGWGKGGVFMEGTSYDSSWHLGEILAAHLTATGQNLGDTNGLSFLRESLLWRIYSTSPDGAHENALGDQSRVQSAPIFDYDRLRALACLPVIRDSKLRAQTKWWLDHAISVKQCTFGPALAQEFLFYDPLAPSSDYTKTLPTAYCARGPGLGVKRSSWSSDALYWYAWSGPLTEAHQDHDCNGFVIWKNGWLIGTSKVWGSNWSLSTSVTNNQNNLTIGGHGQAKVGAAGRLVEWTDSLDHTVFVGQAAGVYIEPKTKPPKPLCKDYLRRLVFLNPNIFVIHDRIKLPSPSTIEWRLQSKNPPAISGQRFSWDNGMAKLFGQTLAPSSVTTQATPVKAGPKGAISSYRPEVVTRPVTAADFLTVLEVAPMGQSKPTSIQPIAGGVEVAGKRVIFSHTDDTVLIETSKR